MTSDNDYTSVIQGWVVNVAYIKRKLGVEVYNISQGAGGGYSHKDNQGNALYHYDWNSGDTGIDSIYAFYPFEVIGVHTIEKTGFSNTVHFYDSENDVTVAMTHDNAISDMYVGKVLAIGEKMYDEGTAGNATGNHVHFEMAKGKITGKTKINGVWTMYNLIPIEDYWYLDTTYTTIKETKGHDLELREGEKVDKPLEYTTTDLLDKLFKVEKSVNVRQVPLSNSGLMATIQSGTYNVRCVTNEYTDDYKWCYVEYESDKWGWIALIDGNTSVIDKEVAPTKPTYEELEEHIVVLESENSILKSEVEKLNDTVSNLDNQLISLKMSYDEVVKENDTLKKQLEESKSVDSYSAIQLIALGLQKIISGK